MEISEEIKEMNAILDTIEEKQQRHLRELDEMKGYLTALKDIVIQIKGG